MNAQGLLVSKKPTMTEIAAACGVSQATVSLVLNGAPGTRISAATRSLVQKKAVALGYSVSGKVPARQRIIAMLINDVTSTPHVAGLIEGAAKAANDAGFLISVMPTSGNPETEASVLGFLATMPVAGVIYARLVTQQVIVPARLHDWPSVLLNCYDPADDLPSVVPGDQAAAQTAVLALLNAGHRRVAFIGGEDSIEAAGDRFKGYKRALATQDVPFDSSLVVREGWTIAAGYRAIKPMLALPNPPTAVFCFCDRTACGVYAAAAEKGLVIGQDLSVIGFDNDPYTAGMLPPLTTMELPHADMAHYAVEELVAVITQQRAFRRPTRLKFDCPMVERSSVGQLVPELERLVR
jgi:LacI family transcriptional regulator